MTWDESSVVSAAKTVGREGSVWILYLAGNRMVGVGKTSDFHTLAGSVEARAKDLGFDDFDKGQVRDGYDNISTKVVRDASGNSDTINNKDKPNIVRLSTLGKKLMAKVDNNDEIDFVIKEEIDADVDIPTKPWWPVGECSPDNAVYIRTDEDKEVLGVDESHIHVTASFDCLRCSDPVKHDYEVKLEDGIPVNGWSRFVEVQCTNCGQVWEHLCGNPHQQPSPIN